MYKSLFAVFLLLLSVSVRAEVVQINNNQLQDLVKKGVTLVDVRTLDEWVETGVVAGSEKMTFFDARGNYDAEKWLAGLQQLASNDQPVVLICWTGSRSRMIADWLNQGLGYQQVYNVERGIKDWIGAGEAVVRE